MDQDWKKLLKIDSTDWLLEEEDPGVRYLALRDLVEADVKELAAARTRAHREGPIALIIKKMEKEGYWVQPGSQYYPLYTGTVWSVMLLAQLGASMTVDERIAAACKYVLDYNLTEHGQFSRNGLPSGTLDCLQGALCEALFDLGCTDPRLEKALDYMARSVTGEGIAPKTDRKAPLRYYNGKCGPNFACLGTSGDPCAWGAVKIMLALGKLPAEQRTPLMDRAIAMGIDFLFSRDPARADYPLGYSPKSTGKPSGNWWKFGFPMFYISDILENIEVLARLGCGNDPRLANALQLVLDKQDDQGRWPMEHDYTGKVWVDFGPKKQPNKWVTLRALRVVKMVSEQGYGADITTGE